MNLSDMHAMIPTGIDNGCDISYLSTAWNVSRREARRIIADMINKDMMVCNLGNGYFRDEKYEELTAYRDYIHSYKCSVEKKFYRIDKACKRYGQPKLPICY